MKEYIWAFPVVKEVVPMYLKVNPVAVKVGTAELVVLVSTKV
jgi:hypothetical protein